MSNLDKKCPYCGRYVDNNNNFVFGGGQDTCKQRDSSNRVAVAMPDLLDPLFNTAATVIDTTLDVVDIFLND